METITAAIDPQITFTEEGDVSEATWTVLENGIKVTGDDIDMEFEATEDGGLVGDIFGFKMFFEKQ